MAPFSPLVILHHLGLVLLLLLLLPCWTISIPASYSVVFFSTVC